MEKVNHLKKLGHDAFHRLESLNGKGKWYRVYVARHGSKSEAENAALKLRKSKAISDYLIRAIDEAGENGSHKTEQNGDYYLHVSSYIRKKGAETEIEKLEGEGYEAFHVGREGLERKLFRVYVGTFPSEQVAREKGSKLKRRGLVSYFKPVRLARNGHPDQKSSPSLPVQAETAEVEKKPQQSESYKLQIASVTKSPVKYQEPESPGVTATEVEQSGKTRKTVNEEPKKNEALVVDLPPDYQTLAWHLSRTEEDVVSDRRKESSKKSSKESKTRFSIPLEYGAFFTSEAEGFRIVSNGSSNAGTWSIPNISLLRFSIAPKYQINDQFGLYGGLEKTYSDNIDLTYLSLGPTFTFALPGLFSRLVPTIKAGAVFGELDWAGAPGDFDLSFGWETSAALQLPISKFTLGFSVLHRESEFAFEAPSGQNVSANRDSLDFSGTAISALMSYRF